jgi:cell division protein FtsI/penicillin-binding protein 2
MGARNVDLSTIMPEQSIWARNLQVNGQRRFVYPLQDKNFWIRNFTNEMKWIAEKRLRDKEESQLGDIQITPDQELELAIYRTTERSNLIGEERAVVVANGNGHVCAMVDFKTPNYRLDPNDEKRILDMDKKLYMIGGHGSDEERRCLGSSALLPLRFGMGSTQKPLVYAAVTAGFDLGCPGSPFTGWSALNLDTIRLRCVEMKRGDILQRHYTGIPFHKNSPFRSPFGDEGDTGMVNPLYYIRRSSNYYNSILVFMGSYPADFYSPARVSSFLQIAPSKDETTMLRRVKEPRFMSRQEYEEAWPIMRIGGRPLAFNKSPVSVDQTKSLLQLQFEKLFGLSASFKRNDKTSLYSSISDSIRLSYVYPEPSFLDAKMRTQKGREFAEKTIRQTATGQRKVWNVSPLMMAQMYARLLPGQAKIKLNIDPNCPHPPYANLQSDSNNFDEVMNTIYRGMHEVFTGGTANLVYSNLVINGYLSANPATTSPNRFPNKHYWIYGKTGTIGKIIDKATGRMLRDNDRLLAVVITDHDLTDPELDPDNLHYYVIFMTFYNTPSTYSGLQAEIIKRVMDSDEFKEYM